MVQLTQYLCLRTLSSSACGSVTEMVGGAEGAEFGGSVEEELGWAGELPFA